ncbi:hypothetical protein CP97_14707 [Aurantiacibacter atlanticus]|uniref:Uncharacterized protein n=1 Tax=Aurantiacibacter atlanticus TaxID=1648404 RepID=A0A168M159_9SPHN|nr:hypothetical protein CP97_14707 [Aurantiacibacter atlanticus]
MMGEQMAAQAILGKHRTIRLTRMAARRKIRETIVGMHNGR